MAAAIAVHGTGSEEVDKVFIEVAEELHGILYPDGGQTESPG